MKDQTKIGKKEEKQNKTATKQWEKEIEEIQAIFK